MIAGTIYMYAGSSAPNGFLICDGSAVSRTTYNTLFDAIGVSFGSGDGSTTFNLPNMCGRVPIGISTSLSVGNTGGEETHTLTADEISSHLHSVPQHGHSNNITASIPELTHDITQPVFTYQPPSGTQQGNAAVDSSGILYTATTSAYATRGSNLVIGNHSTEDCVITGGVVDKEAFDMVSAGGGNAHTNMQPFITMNFIISIGD